MENGGAGAVCPIDLYDGFKLNKGTTDWRHALQGADQVDSPILSTSITNWPFELKVGVFLSAKQRTSYA